ncbi:TRAP transporter substrate-binding protein [Pseudoflavonifractor phocaeensis]|uniref:TRAP transporter substrate-binding protein n=1 Tax=Pseudoflavonifractor phocaeensis TaxID=1870988 RepID=UPI00313D8FB5
MKKRTLAMLLACTMMLSLVLTGCGSGKDKGGNGGGGGSNTAVTEDGRDADGNIVDRTAYAVSLGAQWFTDEDLEIWEHIQDKSDNPDKIVWRQGLVNRSMDEAPTLRGDKRFFIELKKALGDRIEFQFYFNSTLGGTADQILGGLQAKSFEGYSYNVGAFYEYTKAFTPLDIGFLIPDLEAGIAVCAPGSEARDLMVQRCIDDCGLRVLMMGAIGMRHITDDKRPIETLEDMKGLKIRVQNNNLHMAMFEALGCSPTPIAFSELFTALQQKTVDGQENPISNIFEQNYVEVQKYMTLSNHLYTAAATVVNEEWYQSLPQDVRDIIDDACVVAQEQSGKDLLNCEAAMLDYMKSAGMQVNELTPEAQEEFKNRAMSMWDEAGGVMGEDYWNSVRTAIEDVVSKM